MEQRRDVQCETAKETESRAIQTHPRVQTDLSCDPVCVCWDLNVWLLINRMKSLQTFMTRNNSVSGENQQKKPRSVVGVAVRQHHTANKMAITNICVNYLITSTRGNEERNVPELRSTTDPSGRRPIQPPPSPRKKRD